MTEVLYGAPVIETGTFYVLSINFIAIVPIVAFMAMISIAIVGGIIDNHTNNNNIPLIAGCIIGVLLMASIIGYMSWLRSGSEDAQAQLATLPSMMVGTKEKYLINISECTDVAGLSKEFNIEEGRTNEEGQLVWAVPKSNRVSSGN